MRLNRLYFIVASLLALSFKSMAIAVPVMGQTLDESPLPACPGTPNCVHEVHAYNILPSELADVVEQALRALSPISFDRGIIDTHTMHAVYRAGFFKDDVDVSILYHNGGSHLYIRSASRVGRNDLGVNKRRLRCIIEALNERLKEVD